MDKKIVGVFKTEHEASQAIQELKQHGFQADDISVIARNKQDLNAIHDETGTKAPEGMASGATTGGLLGGLTGLLAGIGALAIPGIGPIIAAGPIAAALAGAAVGAGAGGLVGGLIGLGIPEEDAASYDQHVGEGRILVMVDADTSKADEINSVFSSFNSVHSNRTVDQNVHGARSEVENTAVGARNAVENKAGGAQNIVENTVDAAFNGSGLEGSMDTGLDTMNSGIAGTNPLENAYRPGMTGTVDLTTADFSNTTTNEVETDIMANQEDLDKDENH